MHKHWVIYIVEKLHMKIYVLSHNYQITQTRKTCANKIVPDQNKGAV